MDNSFSSSRVGSSSGVNNSFTSRVDTSERTAKFARIDDSVDISQNGVYNSTPFNQCKPIANNRPSHSVFHTEGPSSIHHGNQTSNTGGHSVSFAHSVQRPDDHVTSVDQSDGDVVNQSNEETHERIHEDDGQPSVFMSVVLVGNRLGAAYYEVNTSILYTINDVVETAHFLFLKTLLLQVKPECVLTSSKQKENFLEFLKKEHESENSGFSRLEILPSNMFGMESCKRRVIGTNGLPGLSSEGEDEERMVYFTSLLNFDNTCMIQAAGGLLKFLDQTRVGLELETGTQVPVLYIKSIAIKDTLLIEDHSLSSLQIFQKESHPSVYKSSSEKEGLSIFGIMNHTKCQQGSALLREWFLRPSTDTALIERRLKCVSFFVNPRHVELTVTLHDALKNIKNIMRILSKMKSAAVTLNDWQTLYKTLFNSVCIGDICKRLPQDMYIVQKINETFSNQLIHIANLIKQIIDFEESSYLNHFVVKEGVDPQLDEKKRTFDGIPFLMTQVAQEELNNLNDHITKCSVTYLPQLGYLLNVPLTEEMKQTQNYNVDEKLDFRFVTEESVYYKSRGTEELDVKVGDIQCEIRDHETSIMHRLQDLILEHTCMLIKIVETAAELDCLLALASAARELNFCCPEVLVQNENITQIQGGRHPLQEMCVNQFVANDTCINNEEGVVKILTGPNACGKSVYMKQVGIIVYLMHIGSFVPATRAQMTIKDAIYTRIHSRESVSVPLSTFMLDLNQVSTAVNRTRKNSLIIMDEFGKGTSSVDGLALLASTLLYWLDKGVDCPALLVSTHFHSLPNHLPSTDLLQYQTMEVMEEDGELVFLYTVKEGRANYSYACHTARSAGVPQTIVARGEQVCENIRNEEPIIKVKLQSPQTFQLFEQTAEAFLKLDIENDDLQAFLKDIVSNHQDSSISTVY